MTPSHGPDVAALDALRLVLDTNVVVSALLFNRSRLALFRTLWQQKRIQPLASTATARELLRVLAYPKFRLGPEEREALLADYLPWVEVVDVSEKASANAGLPTCRDPLDQAFLLLAHVGAAQCLVSGDDDLLSLDDPANSRRKFSICRPADVLARMSR